MNYDEIYTANPAYFGNPFPEVINYFERQKEMGKLLDVGCGQGRNAIPLAELGYEVFAIDRSHVAIQQLRATVKDKKIHLKSDVSDWLNVADLSQFDFILLDGFFHFYEQQMREEEEKMRQLLSNAKADCKLVFCFADHVDAVATFREMTSQCKCIEESVLLYEYVDPISQWKFETSYYLSVLTNYGQ